MDLKGTVQLDVISKNVVRIVDHDNKKTELTLKQNPGEPHKAAHFDFKYTCIFVSKVKRKGNKKEPI